MRFAMLGLLVCACWRPVDAAAPTDYDGYDPGWYEVPDEPATSFFAELHLEISGRTVTGELPPGIELAVLWPGGQPQRFNGVLPEPPAAARQPSTACKGERAEGLLLAYEGETLVGVSFKPTDRFSYNQTAYNAQVTWNSCGQEKATLSMSLQHDPRLQLALCGSCDAALDRTRLSSISAHLRSDDGTLAFSPSFVRTPDPMTPVRYEVNGKEFVPPDPRLPQPNGTPAEWRPGGNRVKVTLGDLPAWEGVLVLPSGRFAPQATPLSVGADFSVTWTGAAWAKSYLVLLQPGDPKGRVGPVSFRVTEPKVTDRFDGFTGYLSEEISFAAVIVETQAWVGVPEAVPFHGRVGYSLSWSDRVEVRVSR